MNKQIITSVLLLSALLLFSSCTLNPTDNNYSQSVTQSEESETSHTAETVENNSVSYDTDSVKPDVETTETVESQPATGNLSVIVPNQSHVGKWKYLSGNKGKTYEVPDVTLTVSAVDSKTIVFSYTVYKGLELETVAVKKDGKFVFSKDISPYFEFNHYQQEKREGCNDITGSFEFFANSVSFTMTNESGQTSSVMYTEKYETGTSPRELPDDAAKVIDNVIKTLEEKGWKKIKRIKTEPDSLKRWNVKIDPYDPEYKTVVYNLLGSHDGIDIVVRIVFNDQTQKWEPVEVYYADTNGTILKDNTLKTFVDNTGKTGLILHADDADLIEYFG